LPTLATRPRVGPQNAGEPKAHEGGQMGGQGGASPLAGAWGCPPQNQKGGELPTLATPPTSGTQSAGKPKACEDRKGGPGGRSPHGRGFGGCAPKNLKGGGELPPLATWPRVGPQNAGEPKACEGGKGGPGGRSPLPGGLGDVPPRTLRRGRVAPISNPATSGTQSAGEP